MDHVPYTPIPYICQGVITNYISEKELYEVFIHKSPGNSLMDVIPASSIHQPGLHENYAIGDSVKVLMTWGFGGVDNKFLSPCSSNTNQILGLYNEKSIVNVKPEHPLTGHSSGILTFCNKNNSAGFSVEDDGSVRQVSGIVHTLLKGFGYGIEKDMYQVTARNHFRIIADNPPYYMSKEHFGMFLGSSLNDLILRTKDSDFPVIFRRFVTQTASDDNWVSTCEGTFAPFLGANNNFGYIKKSRDTLFTKIVNNDKSRVTLEMGELDNFVHLRIDDIKQNELMQTSGDYGATTALVGNRFSLKVNNEGSVDLRAAGKGQTLKDKNTHGFHLTIDTYGNLTIHSKGKITFSHSVDDESNNSITLDPDKGVDIIANKGFRVNGLELVTSKFLDWFDTHKYNMCLVTAIGGPAPLFDIPTFESGKKLLGGQGGFITDNKNPSAKGIIEDIINFSTI
jgi:hypothetical protein